MIHCFLIQQSERLKRAYREASDTYSEESVVTVNHILVHAMLKYLWLRAGMAERVQADISASQDYPDYKKAWAIVERDGEENILDRFCYCVGIDSQQS